MEALPVNDLLETSRKYKQEFTDYSEETRTRVCKRIVDQLDSTERKINISCIAAIEKEENLFLAACEKKELNQLVNAQVLEY
jgi:hypothetical protein